MVSPPNPTVPFTVQLAGSITSQTQSQVFTPQKPDFVIGIGGTFSGTVQIERNRANVGGTLGWVVVSADPTNQSTGGAIYTAPIELDLYEPVFNGTQYRINCTNYVSGTILYEFWG